MSAEENKICVESTIRHAFVDVDSVLSFIILGPQHSPILRALVPLVPPIKIPDKENQNPDFQGISVKSTMTDLFKDCQNMPFSSVILLILFKIRTFDKNQDQIWTSLVK